MYLLNLRFSCRQGQQNPQLNQDFYEKNYRNLRFSPLFVLSRKNYLVASHRLLLMPRIAHSLCCSAFSYFRPSPPPSQADVEFVKYFAPARFPIFYFTFLSCLNWQNENGGCFTLPILNKLSVFVQSSTQIHRKDHCLR